MTDLAFDPTGAPVLRRGQGPADWVAYLQNALTSLNLQPGTADGDFGGRTEDAVKAFQRAAGLNADGVVGPLTWEALARALGSTSTAGRFDPATAPLLRRGDRGDWVTYLQGLLTDAGHDPGPIDGIFGPLTEAGVRSFQQSAGIAVDGIVGPQTWTALEPVAEVHPSNPPIGSPVIHGGGGGGTPGGGGGTPGETQVSVGIQPAAAIADGTLDVTWAVANHGGKAVTLVRLERGMAAAEGSLAGPRDVGEEIAAGATNNVVDGMPMGPAPSGETYSVTFSAMAVFDPGDGTEHLSAVAEAIFSVDDQGNVTSGGSPLPSDGPSGPTGTHVTLTINTADRLADDGLLVNFPTHNASAGNVFISGLDWMAHSQGETFSRNGDHSAPLGAGEDVVLSDVAPLGPAAGEPYPVTFMATVTYFLDDGTEHRSGHAERTVMIDGDGVVGGAAPGSGGGSGGGGGTPSLTLAVDAFCSDNTLGCFAAVNNGGDGTAEDVRVSATLSGPFNDSKVTQADGLPPGNGIVAEVGAQLPADRSDTLLFVLEGTVTSSNAAGSTQSIGLSVSPDGTVQKG